MAASSAALACDTAICQPEALDVFFARLDAAPYGRPIHIVQIGDSHTAGDLITASLRSRLQARFGRGGRGVIPPGRPYPGYQPRQIEVTETGWSSQTSAPGRGAWPASGLSGTRAMVAGAGGQFEMLAEPSALFRRVVVCGAGQGRVILSAGAMSHALEFDAAPACRAVVLDAAAERLTLAPAGGAVDLYSVATFADDGLVLSNLGVIGTTLADMAARDEAVIAAELSAWTPDLIVLAYGTNEGFDPLLDITAYEALLRAQIARLRALAPEASLMILGAPDALSPNGGAMCEAAMPDQTPWAPPQMLGLVRDVQSRVAADMGVAFWDWRRAMGGDCSANRLATAVEPLMRTDRVHFNSTGGDWIGRLLFDDLMAAYGARVEASAP
jgi:lysophospholipase L1-like esterase